MIYQNTGRFKSHMVKNVKTHTSFVFHISQVYLYLMCANLMLSTLFFFLGITVAWWWMPISFIAAVLMMLRYYDSEINRIFVYEMITAGIIILVMIWFCGSVYDSSADGNSYQKLAVGLLTDGWNPVKELPNEKVHVSFGRGIPSGQMGWVEAYAKQPWILAASVYAFTGNIECGKIYTMLSMFSAFGFTVYYLYNKNGLTIFSLLIALAASMNPVAVAQLDSFYVDGCLHMILYVLVLALTINLDDRSGISQKTTMSLIASAMIVCANVKFTGLLYGGIYCIVYYILYSLIKIKAAGFRCWKAIFKEGIWFGSLAAVCIVWAGFPTYITNFVRHGTIVYPLAGPGAVDIMTANSPFPDGRNHIINLGISLFSRLDNWAHATIRPAKLKAPFTFDSSEFSRLSLTDARLSGFGIFFSGMLLCSILAISVYLLKKKKNFTEKVYWGG